MRFVGEVLGDINGIQNYYIVGLLIFVTLLLVIVYRTVKMPKKELHDIKTSIFDKEELIDQGNLNR